MTEPGVGLLAGEALSHDDDVLCRVNDPATAWVLDPVQASLLTKSAAAQFDAGLPIADSAARRLYSRLTDLAHSDQVLAQEARAFVAALPTDVLGILRLGNGLEEGLVLGLADFVTSTVKGLWKTVQLLSEYLSAISDPRVWASFLQDLWDGTPGQHVYQDLDQLYPEFSQTLQGVQAIGVALAQLVESLTVTDSEDLLAALTLAADLVDNAPWIVARLLLNPTLTSMIGAKGDPEDQGRIIGRALGPPLCNLALFAVGLFPAIEAGVVAEAAVVADDAAVTLRLAMTADQSVSLAKVAASASPELPQAAAQAGSLYDQAVAVYQGLAYRIASYEDLTEATYEFNSHIRHLYGLKTWDAAYVTMRLDAHHVIEGAWWPKFPEFARIWTTADDMPCIALHTEWHIRSGTKLAANLDLFGAEAEPSLTTSLQKFVADAQLTAEGAPKPFTGPSQLLDAYEAYYQKTKLWDKVESVFVEVRAKLAALPPTPPPH